MCVCVYIYIYIYIYQHTYGTLISRCSGLFMTFTDDHFSVQITTNSYIKARF